MKTQTMATLVGLGTLASGSARIAGGEPASFISSVELLC